MDAKEITELKLKIKTEECETYKKLLESQTKNTLDVSRANLKAIVAVCSTAIISIAFIIGFFFYCYFNSNYSYGEYNNISNNHDLNIQGGE